MPRRNGLFVKRLGDRAERGALPAAWHAPGLADTVESLLLAFVVAVPPSRRCERNHPHLKSGRALDSTWPGSPLMGARSRIFVFGSVRLYL